MALIKSISGIRGTIGGNVGDNLTPIDLVKFTSAFALFIKEKNPNKENFQIVVGRDARISGEMVQSFVNMTVRSFGYEVISIDFATTPTTEMAVIHGKYDGGIIITASHNPINWNALKLLNEKGEFLSQKDGERILELSQESNIVFPKTNILKDISKFQVKGSKDISALECHVEEILKLKYLKEILCENKTKKFLSNIRIAVDCINSVGSISVPFLLMQLGVDKKNIVLLNNDLSGNFAHNPEPIPENLTDISRAVVENKCDIGFAVDPDVDRLAIVSEDGSFFGEEYTLVACADYVLSKNKGNLVSNLSSSRALRDIAEKYNVEYNAAAVGEVNVVEKMKSTNSIIGGEGNGGVILPELHYGRDALVGIALFLALLSEKNQKVSELRKTYPNYCISKNKIELNDKINIEKIFEEIIYKYSNETITTIDGVKIDFLKNKEWVHLRKSNTEPIIRIYAESADEKKANILAKNIIEEINKIIKQWKKWFFLL